MVLLKRCMLLTLLALLSGPGINSAHAAFQSSTCAKSIQPSCQAKGLQARAAAKFYGGNVTVVVIPGGGWLAADPASVQNIVNDFLAEGIYSRAITYPLGDVQASFRSVRAQIQADRARGPVVLYGISAGGTIASFLAARGEVAGAVSQIPPTDFTQWKHPFARVLMPLVGLRTLTQKRLASPYFALKGKQTPQLVQCGTLDALVPYSGCRRYVMAARRRQYDTTLQGLPMGHEHNPVAEAHARRWVKTRWNH